MKKVLVLLALLAAVCGLLSFSAAAESAAASGICGENLTWTLDAAGTLTVSGTGAMEDYNYKDAPWHQSRDSIKAVVVESGVTTIGGSAFNDCSSLTSINFPDSVTVIGEYAFESCSSLTSITIPESVTTIGSYAFCDCTSLSSITIPEGVTAIGSYAFCDCTSLSSIEIPEGVTVIRPNVFCGASGIQRVALSKNLKGVLGNAFDGCTNIKEVFYEGSESEWAKLPIATGNDPLKNATIYYNSTIDDFYCRITVEVSEGGRVAVSANTAKAGTPSPSRPRLTGAMR